MVKANVILVQILIALLLIFAATAKARADLSDGTCKESQKAQVRTEHTAVINGVTVAYTATVGFIEVTADDLKSKACVFYTAYVVTNQPAAQRPLTFAFNGGPGSASLWLHMGIMGPKRIDLGSDGLTPASLSNAVIDNPWSPLDVTDIVMIDPVATGFSHVEGDAKNDAFFGAKNDYRSVAAFIQNYLNTNNRWASPKFVLGESYGGIRGSLLANHLQSDFGIALNGLILVSPALSMTSLDFTIPDNNVPYWTFFPNFATTAWYHKKSSAELLTKDVDAVYSAAKKFADTALRDALEQGSNLDPATFESVSQTMASFLGLSQKTVQDLNLRIADLDYFTGLLKDKNSVIGRFDSRFVGANSTPIRTPTDIADPSDSGTSFQFTAGINQYLRVDLNFPLTSPYNTSINPTPWPVDSDGTIFNVLGNVSHALTDNPQLKVMIASGYFDLACPMATVAFELSQLPGGATLRSRISQHKYFGGHMMYINPSALKELKTDMANFIGQQKRLTPTLRPN